MPTNIMMTAMMIVVVRSILLRFFEYFFKLAIFSVIIMRIPEIESIKLCAASEIIAIEFEIRPTNKLKIESRKFIKMKRYPDFTIVLLRAFSIVLF